ncbi:MAG: PAS domain-containing protein [Chloroflexi bacterium]|nr:PAS domain-containing protein [Chloroflexota bacterium]
MPVDLPGAIALVSPFVAATVTLALIGMICRRRNAPGALAIIIIFGLSTLRLLAMGIGLWSVDLDSKLEWRRIELTMQWLIPVALLATSLLLTQRSNRVTRTWILVALLIPAGLIAVIWISGLSGTVFSQPELRTTSYGISVLSTVKEPLGVLINIYSLLLAVTSVLVVVLQAKVLRNQNQTMLIILGAAVPPILANLVDSLWLAPAGSSLNPIPFSFLITAVIMIVAFVRYGLLELTPIAHAALADQLTDAVVVLSASDKIIEINPAAIRLFDAVDKNLVGQSFTEIAPQKVSESSRALREGQSMQVLVGDRYLEVKNVLLRNRPQDVVGKIVLVRDVSAQRRAEIGGQRVFTTLSHEIRSALTLLSGFGDDLDKTYVADMSQEQMTRLLRLIKGGVGRLVDTSVAMGDWIELTTNPRLETTLQRQRVAAEALVKSAISKMEEHGHLGARLVDVNLTKSETVVVTDVARLQRVLETVLLRAVSRSTSEDGNIVITGNTSETFYKITITDDGRRLSPEIERMIFDPFAGEDPGEIIESENVEIERYRLATAKGFVEQLGGKMSHTQSSESGCAIVIHLPISTGTEFESLSLATS